MQFKQFILKYLYFIQTKSSIEYFIDAQNEFEDIMKQ